VVGVSSCMLIGRLFLLVRLVGSDMFGMLVRLVGIVVMLLRYMVSGLLSFLLSWNVVVGVVGEMRMLVCLKVVLKLWVISV